MKKFLIAVFLFVGGLMFLAPQANLLAEDGEQGFIELYPYDNKDSMDPNSGWTGTMVGTSNWTFTFDKWRYHASRGQVRYVKDWEDANNDGVITATEMTHKTWASFGTININDTVEDVILSTVNGRTDISSNVVDRIWARFDEEGKLYMFEDQIFADYLIVNEGDQTPEGQDWRLATDAEIEAFNASEDAATEFPNMLKSHIRLLIDETTEQGYILEPIRYITWNHLWFGQDGFDDQPKTIIPQVALLDSPDDVLIKAGDTVVTFGSLDRDGTNKQTVEFIKELPYIMTGLRDGENKIEAQYELQPPTFGNTLAHLDKDSGTPGINYIIDYQGEFETADLVDGVAATYLKMFDENGAIVNEVTNLDFEIIIEQNGAVVETINVVWDAEEAKYEATAEITVIDTSIFGDGFTVTYKAVSPEEATHVTEELVEVAIGVIPPRFEDVPTTVYVDERTPIIDLVDFAGITANNGYGVDLTDRIVVSTPANFNQFNPTPGTYKIDLELLYNVFIPGEEFELYIKGTKVAFNAEAAFNKDININAYLRYSVFTETEHLADSLVSWGSMIVIVDANGKVKESYSRYDYLLVNEENPDGIVVDNGAEGYAEWQSSIELAPGEFVVAGHGSTDNVGPTLRALRYGDDVTLVIGTDDIDHDFVVNTSFNLVVDDKTAPTLSVRNANYKVTAGEFTNVNQAILANVLVTDNFTANPTVVVTNSGGLNLNEPGLYTVKVLASDDSGNDSQELTFTVEVVADKAAELENEIADLEDKLTEANDKAAELEDKIADLETQIDGFQEALDAKKEGTSLVVTIVVAVVAAGLAFGGAFLLGRKTP